MGIEELIIAAKAESNLGKIPSQLVDQAFNETACVTACVLLMNLGTISESLETRPNTKQDVQRTIARTYFDALANLLGYTERKKDLHEYTPQQRTELALGLKEFYLDKIKEIIPGFASGFPTRLKELSLKVIDLSRKIGQQRLSFNTAYEVASYLKREYASFDKGQGIAAAGSPR